MSKDHGYSDSRVDRMGSRQRELQVRIKTLESALLEYDKAMAFYDKEMSFKPVSGIEYCNMDYCVDHGSKARETRKEFKELIEGIKND